MCLTQKKGGGDNRVPKIQGKLRKQSKQTCVQKKKTVFGKTREQYLKTNCVSSLLRSVGAQQYYYRWIFWENTHNVCMLGYLSMCATWLIHMCDVIIHICDMMHPHVWYGESIGYNAIHMRIYMLQRNTHVIREVGGWGRDPKKCTGRDWGMGSSTI